MSDVPKGPDAPQDPPQAAGPDGSPKPPAPVVPATVVSPPSAAADANAAFRLKVAGVVLALVGAGLLVLLALSVNQGPFEPSSEAAAKGGGQLTFQWTGPQPVDVAVRGLDGILLGNGTTSNGTIVFRDMARAGMVVNASTDGQSWQRHAFVARGSELTLRLGPADAAAVEGWEGGPRRLTATEATVQMVILLLLVAGGTAMATRRFFLLAMLGSALLVGQGLPILIAGGLLMGGVMMAMGIWQIILLRRGRHLFRRARA